MIEPMKKVSVVILNKEKEEALKALRNFVKAVKKTEKEDIYALMATFMKANIKMIKKKDMVFSNLKEVINMKENLKIIFLIEKENIYCIQNYLNI